AGSTGRSSAPPRVSRDSITRGSGREGAPEAGRATSMARATTRAAAALVQARGTAGGRRSTVITGFIDGESRFCTVIIHPKGMEDTHSMPNRYRTSQTGREYVH